VSTSVIEHR